MTDEWVSSGTTYTAIKMNVTDTASAPDSLLLNLLVGGNSVLQVNKDGWIGVGDTPDHAICVSHPTRRSVIRVDTQSSSGFNAGFRLDFNGSTFAGILACAVADDSLNVGTKVQDVVLSARTGLCLSADNYALSLRIRDSVAKWFVPIRKLNAIVADLPAPSAALDGAEAYVTDSTVTLAAGIGSIVAGTGGNKVPVYCDATNWRIG